jgi:hypothetical protein
VGGQSGEEWDVDRIVIDDGARTPTYQSPSAYRGSNKPPWGGYRSSNAVLTSPRHRDEQHSRPHFESQRYFVRETPVRRQSFSPEHGQRIQYDTYGKNYRGQWREGMYVNREVDCRERESDYFSREYNNGQGDYNNRYEDVRASHPIHISGPALPEREYAGNNQGGNGWRGGSPLPSSWRQHDGVNVKDEIQKKKYVELDKNGKPQGKMADLVKYDVQAFTKELHPNLGWEKQKDEAKRRLKQRLGAKYQFGGESDLLGEKYLQKQVTKGLISFRFNLNQHIDQGQQKPPELRDEFLAALVQKRSTNKLKERSQRMATIAKRQATKNST